MRNLKLSLLTLLTASFFMTTSCKKGDTGPVGPAGPDSVMYSNWIAINMTGTLNTNTGDSVYTGSITAPNITSKILNTGMVVGYLLLSDPLTGDSSAVNAINFLSEYFTPGFIDLVSFTGDFTGVGYRYVIVPAKVAITGTDGQVQTYSSEQMKQMDYTTLTGLLKIPVKGSGSKQFNAPRP